MRATAIPPAPSFVPLFALLLAGPASAHDFWLRPDAYRVATGRPLGVDVRVGDDFEGQALPRDPGLIERFFTRGPAVAGDEASREAPVAGLDGRAPAGFLRLEREGLHWVALTTHAHEVELPAARFHHYLAEEGLERILTERARRDEASIPGRERYSRCAKSAVLVGEGRGGDWSAVLGLPLELVLERDPAGRAAGEALGVRLLARGAPLAGALVSAVRRGAPERVLSARTDAEGRVRLALEAPGEWLISAVHMARDDEHEDADWRSWWASLTFELPPPDPARARDTTDGNGKDPDSR